MTIRRRVVVSVAMSLVWAAVMLIVPWYLATLSLGAVGEGVSACVGAVSTTGLLCVLWCVWVPVVITRADRKEEARNKA